MTTEIQSARMSLAQLVARLEEFRTSKVDIVAPLSSFRIDYWEGQPDPLRLAPIMSHENVVKHYGRNGKPVTMKALCQLAEKLPVPVPSRFVREYAAKYPGGVADVFNRMLGDVKGKAMIRGLGGNVRAFLSDQFRILDHYDTAVAALDVAKKFGAVPIECSLTESHMRLKFTTPRVADYINVRKNGGPSEGYLRAIVDDLFKDGDRGVAHPLVTVTNSETGDGGLNISRGIFIPRCRNGIVIEKSLRAVHVGKRLDEGLLSDEAIAADAKATMPKARDLITNSFEVAPFKELMVKVHDAAGLTIDKPNEAVERVCSDLGLSEDDSQAILSHFLRDYDTTRFGLAGAVSRHAQDLEPEKAATLETYAGTLITA
jgi:hypothetical protein